MDRTLRSGKWQVMPVHPQGFGSARRQLRSIRFVSLNAAFSSSSASPKFPRRQWINSNEDKRQKERSLPKIEVFWYHQESRPKRKRPEERWKAMQREPKTAKTFVSLSTASSCLQGWPEVEMSNLEQRGEREREERGTEKSF